MAYCGATIYTVNSEENMKKLKDAETRVTVGDSRILTRKNVAIGTAGRDVIENYTS